MSDRYDQAAHIIETLEGRRYYPARHDIEWKETRRGWALDAPADYFAVGDGVPIEDPQQSALVQVTRLGAAFERRTAYGVADEDASFVGIRRTGTATERRQYAYFRVICPLRYDPTMEPGRVRLVEGARERRRA